MSFVPLHNLQDALHSFEMVHAQFANSSPKPDPTLNLTLTLIVTEAQLCSSSKCMQQLHW